MPLPSGLEDFTPRGGAPIDIGVERERRMMRLRKTVESKPAVSSTGTAGDRHGMFVAEARAGARREVLTRISRVESN